MIGMRRAVIDVGTNSVKLLVADVSGCEVIPVLEDSEQTRLGAGFYTTRRLQPEAVLKTAEAVAAFAKQAVQLGAEKARVIATSAARDALNAKELTDAIKHLSGLETEVISGESEADLAFRGVASLPELAAEPLMLLDVGGGSTEFILGQGEHRHFCRSFPLGTVRLLEALPPGDPPTKTELERCREHVREFLEGEVLSKLRTALKRESNLDANHRTALLVGTGGTSTILARMHHRQVKFDRDILEGTVLSLETVQEYARKLWGMSLAKRRDLPGVPRKRADVILTGVVIYEGVMETLGFAKLRVSTRGLRFAAIMDAK